MFYDLILIAPDNIVKTFLSIFAKGHYWKVGLEP